MFTRLPEVGVLISGDPEAPTITNHTDRCIIAYIIRTQSLELDGAYAPLVTTLHRAVPLIRDGSARDQISVPAHSSRVVGKSLPPVGTDLETGWAVTAVNVWPNGPIARVYLDLVVWEEGEYAGSDPSLLVI